MNKQQLKKELTEFIDYYNKDSKLWNNVDGLFGGDNTVIISHDELMDRYINEFMLRINDRDRWIFWFIFENNQGKRGFEAGYNLKNRKIETIDDLCDLIEIGWKPVKKKK